MGLLKFFSDERGRGYEKSVIFTEIGIKQAVLGQNYGDFIDKREKSIYNPISNVRNDREESKRLIYRQPSGLLCD